MPIQRQTDFSKSVFNMSQRESASAERHIGHRAAMLSRALLKPAVRLAPNPFQFRIRKVHCSSMQGFIPVCRWSSMGQEPEPVRLRKRNILRERNSPSPHQVFPIYVALDVCQQIYIHRGKESPCLGLLTVRCTSPIPPTPSSSSGRSMTNSSRP